MKCNFPNVMKLQCTYMELGAPDSVGRETLH